MRTIALILDQQDRPDLDPISFDETVCVGLLVAFFLAVGIGVAMKRLAVSRQRFHVWFSLVVFAWTGALVLMVLWFILS